MNSPVQILIVEEELVIADNISRQLSGMGYQVTGIASSGEQALISIRKHPPDILLMDIRLKGCLDGIQTARIMQQDSDIPIIYLTANDDEENFNRAKNTHPSAFISQPYKPQDLKHAIELIISREREKPPINSPALKNIKSPNVLSDSIFVRNHDKMEKIFVRDIFFIEAERNYCRIYSKGKEYLLVMTLKELDQKLPAEHFVRIHRSYIVNVEHIDEVAISYLVVVKRTLPVSRSFRKNLLTRLQTI